MKHKFEKITYIFLNVDPTDQATLEAQNENFESYGTRYNVKDYSKILF